LWKNDPQDVASGAHLTLKQPRKDEAFDPPDN
jgi:hypothetical protein